MTSEVVLMNQLAVAMAADSAVTVGDGQKIYQSAIKLFTLSKYHPVGVMIFNAAGILGYPWETIIKAFRHKLGGQKFETVSAYADSFRNFLHRNERGLFAPELQKRFAMAAASESIQRLAQMARDKYYDAPIKQDQPRDSILSVVAGIVRAEREKQGERPVMKCFSEGIENDLLEFYGEDLAKLTISTLKEWIGFLLRPEDEPSLNDLAQQVVMAIAMKFTREPKFGHYSGIVFAGFGDNEFLPSMSHVIVSGVLCNQLKWQNEEQVGVSPDGGPVIRPFAESQMVNTFMTGIDPSLKDIGAIGSVTMVFELVNLVIDSIDDLSLERKDHWREHSSNAAADAWKKYQSKLQDHMRDNHQIPLQRVISSLPKDELAEVAESMVSLNALKLKVSHAKETVGGPIDVAVITKGDGFIWIKRKHYFRPELNPQFAANYYRSDEGIQSHGSTPKTSKPGKTKKRRARPGKSYRT